MELVEELSISSFINALRRFVSIRGPVRQFRFDRGTNFVGALSELQMVHQFVEKPPVQKFLHDGESTWLFNPPHASHFGGVWERMIGITRRILDGILLRTGMKSLTHETLSISMAEVNTYLTLYLPSIRRICTSPRGALFKVSHLSFGASGNLNTCLLYRFHASGPQKNPS